MSPEPAGELFGYIKKISITYNGKAAEWLDWPYSTHEIWNTSNKQKVSAEFHSRVNFRSRIFEP